ESGILRIPPNGPAPGSTLPVGTVLGYLVQPGEPAPFETSGREPESPGDNLITPGVASTVPSAEPGPGAGSRERHAGNEELAAENGQRKPRISPRARRVAAELGIDWSLASGSGRTRRIVERDIRALALARPAGVEVRASPLARRMAQELGVDLAQLAANQSGRKIERADVEQAARASAPAATSRASIPWQAPGMSGVRKITAARMTESARTAAAVTLTTEADATELARLRANIAADLEGSDLTIPSYNDLLTRLVALALLEHPALNATLTEDAIVQHSAVHIGIAVDGERGLLVPVVHDAHSKSVQQIAAESARLIAKARSGKVAAGDLQGGTFTISNLGMYDIDAFTPIINLPECAILGVGRIVARPVVVDEQAETIAVRKMMVLSLTFDHRLVDGAPAARFLQRVKQLIEHPYAWLTR
ncbi:MAG TPA: dihydrolipoamide acetyltransferase family protein, partial [Roseiflexaceae bacterium]|nr:dihydrolipoamide acetyltransferase family protein [Roseiflexaceae bacterium]